MKTMFKHKKGCMCESCKKKQDFITEDVTIKLNTGYTDTDYIITDVTVLDEINDGDVQAPDIDGLLKLAEQALQEKYGNFAISLKTVATVNKMLTENYQYSIVDVQTKEVTNHLKEKGIKDAFIGNIYLIESTKSGLPRFKVNSLTGTTKYSKVTRNLKEEIQNYIESEFLHEASIEFEAKKLQERNAELKKLTEFYLAQHPEIKSHKMFIENQIKSYTKLGTLDDVKDNIFDDIYALAAGFPLSSKVLDTDKNEKDLVFESIEEIIKILFGEKWIREYDENTGKPEKPQTLKEATLPNISEFVYDLDVDKGNAWSVNSYTKDGRGNKIIIVSKNGKSENSAEDIKKAVEAKHKNLKGYVSENKNHIWFYLKEQALTEAKTPTYRFKNSEISRAEYDKIADHNSPEYKYINGDINWGEYEKLADHNSADYKFLAGKINRAEYDKLNERTLTEAYQTFTIGDIEGTFNNQTNEVVYSIPAKNISDKKLNISEVADVDQPYDTETIIKDYIVKNLVRPEDLNNQEPVEEIEVDANMTEADEDIEVDVDAPVNGEEPVEVDVETQEEAKQETGSAVFFKTKQNSPVSLEDLRQRALNGVASQQSSYLVVEEKTLSQEDWDAWTADLSQSKDFLRGIKPIDRKNYAFNVVKITTPSQSYALLVDPVGYDYARYVAISE